jgi:glyceraldehyde 3-phosphate dehydrogenase
MRVTLTDCVFNVKTPVTREQDNKALKKASETAGPPLAGRLSWATIRNQAARFDGLHQRHAQLHYSWRLADSTVIDGTMVKIYAWYDNEAGYSKRMAELCNIVAAMNITDKEPSFKYE